VHVASEQQCGEATVEALFRGYFEEGVDLSELSEIVGLLERHAVELDSADLCARLAAGEGRREVASDRRQASEYGVGAVPLFIFDQRYTLEGARPIEDFQRLIAKLRAEDGPHWRGASPL
jgi:predicted DsbA family dithiol-disulfide isomerase